jgi:hypothetical protein
MRGDQLELNARSLLLALSAAFFDFCGRLNTRRILFRSFRYLLAAPVHLGSRKMFVRAVVSRQEFRVAPAARSRAAVALGAWRPVRRARKKASLLKIRKRVAFPARLALPANPTLRSIFLSR